MKSGPAHTDTLRQQRFVQLQKIMVPLNSATFSQNVICCFLKCCCSQDVSVAVTRYKFCQKCDVSGVKTKFSISVSFKFKNMHWLGAAAIVLYVPVTSLTIHSDRVNGDYETGKDIELAFSTEDTLRTVKYSRGNS